MSEWLSGTQVRPLTIRLAPLLPYLLSLRDCAQAAIQPPDGRLLRQALVDFSKACSLVFIRVRVVVLARL